VKICPVCSTEYADDVKFCPNDGQTLRAAAPATDLVGQVIADRYHVVKKLGEGGMGQVYLAEHVKMGRRSAIKVMNPSMVHDHDAVARFNREAANASRITHPNVCAVYDFGETPDGMIYLAMEFIEGEPLTDLVEREHQLPLPRAVDIFAQVADALQAAHDLGIVHRDLKPDNIMLSRGRDGRDVVKVVDFGIAKAVGGDEAGQKVTKTGLVVGTPEFMSPEQLSGDKVDGRSDLYSLALVLFQMLTGELPFKADSVQETMIKRLTDEPKKLAAARPDLTFPAGLQAVLDTALAKLPTERYQQVTKFAGDVTAVAGRGGVTAAMPATRAQAVDTEARTQVLAASETAAMAAKPAPGRAPAKPPAKKRSLVPVIVGAVVVLGGAGAGLVLMNGKTGGTPADSTGTTPPLVTGADGRTETRAGSDSQRNGGTQRPGTQPFANRETTSTVPPPAAPRVIPALAAEALDSLLELVDRSPQVARDSAQVFYNASGVADIDKAMAAFVIANTYWRAGDRPRGCQWIARARTLDPANPTFTTVTQSECQ
jgi:serine/threonine-protein kinase